MSWKSIVSRGTDTVLSYIIGVYKSDLDLANFDLLMDLRGIKELYGIDVSFIFNFEGTCLHRSPNSY